MLIDLNCDLAEGMPTDGDVIPFITSANVACCMHAGSPATALRTMRLCQSHGVVIGAHPGYSDRERFGRHEMDLPLDELVAEIVFQVTGLIALAKSFEMELKYIKPHGALYNQACRQESVASAVAMTASVLDLPLLGLPNSMLQAAASVCPSLGYFAEGFADRRYLPDGSLVPRDQPDAFLHDPREATEQVEWLIRERGVRSVCVHGDNQNAVEFVRVLRESLVAKGHTLRAFA
jgi:UPF0271 protein